MFVVPSLSDGGAERVVSVLSSELSKMVERVCVLIYWDTEQNYPVSSKVKIINLSGGNKHSYVHQMVLAIEDAFQNYEMTLKKGSKAKEMARNRFGAAMIAQQFLKIANEVLNK